MSPSGSPPISTTTRTIRSSAAIEWLTAECYVDEADADAELATRAVTRETALAAATQPRGLLVDVDTIADRWREIEQTLDAGHDVMLRRDGRPWATISAV